MRALLDSPWADAIGGLLVGAIVIGVLAIHGARHSDDESSIEGATPRTSLPDPRHTSDLELALRAQAILTGP